ncbi:MAG: hypothetical protein R2851_07860 [Caldilineaceae bacterium]
MPPPTSPLEGEWIGRLRLLFWALVTLSVIYAIVSPQYRRMVIRTTIFIIAFVLITNRLLR